MLRFLLLCCFWSSVCVSLSAQVDYSVTYAEKITAAGLKQHLDILASDAYEGRETGQPGIDIAADYISEGFKNAGIPPLFDNNKYVQPVSFIWHTWKKSSLNIQGVDYRHLWDYYTLPHYNNDVDALQVDEVVFLGYGIQDPMYNDYRKIKKGTLFNKTIIIYSGEPVNKESLFRISETNTLSSWSTDVTKKLEVAKAYGVSQVIIIDTEFEKNVKKWRSRLNRSYLSLDDKSYRSGWPYSIVVSPEMADAIWHKKKEKINRRFRKIKTKGKFKAVKFDTKLVLTQSLSRKLLKGQNVLGYIEGSDPILKDELIIITAHYDHLGKRGYEIYNGADDNASGTSAVLQMAEAFAQAKKDGHGTKRSVLCMLMTGEEKGLLGSQYYCQYPVWDLDQTVVNMNIDMIGRVDKNYIGNPDYIYVIGADRISSDLHQINEDINKKYANLTLDYRYNAEDDPNRYYYRSDHYNFAKKGIPAVFYFNGTHDDYHRPTDTAEKINFQKMEKISRHIFHTAWAIANRHTRINRDKWDASMAK